MPSGPAGPGTKTQARPDQHWPRGQSMEMPGALQGSEKGGQPGQGAPLQVLPNGTSNGPSSQPMRSGQQPLS
eukprot:14771255-Alexandrium_andersonii.AAC.1